MEGSSTLSLGEGDELCFMSDGDMAQLIWGVTAEQVAPSGKWCVRLSPCRLVCAHCVTWVMCACSSVRGGRGCVLSWCS